VPKNGPEPLGFGLPSVFAALAYDHDGNASFSQRKAMLMPSLYLVIGSSTVFVVEVRTAVITEPNTEEKVCPDGIV